MSPCPLQLCLQSQIIIFNLILVRRFETRSLFKSNRVLVKLMHTHLEEKKCILYRVNSIHFASQKKTVKNAGDCAFHYIGTRQKSLELWILNSHLQAKKLGNMSTPQGSTSPVTETVIFREVQRNWFDSSLSATVLSLTNNINIAIFKKTVAWYLCAHVNAHAPSNYPKEGLTKGIVTSPVGISLPSRKETWRNL